MQLKEARGRAGGSAISLFSLNHTCSKIFGQQQAYTRKMKVFYSAKADIHKEVKLIPGGVEVYKDVSAQEPIADLIVCVPRR
jgi:hypothetical protein